MHRIRGLVPGVWAMMLACSIGAAQVFKTPTPGVSAKVPPGCRAKSSAFAEAYTGTGFAEKVIHRKSGVDLAFIPAGNFVMGASVKDGPDWNAERPQHLVTLAKPFYIARYEVSVEQFRRFVKETGYKTEVEKRNEKPKSPQPEAMSELGGGAQAGSEPTWMAPGFPQTDRHPAVCLSWNDAKAFCAWAGLRLPSEAEWEYACRAGTKTVYCFGNDKAGLAEYGTFQIDQQLTGPTPVGSKAPNPWGLFDVYGNVYEWCEDPWHESYDHAPADGSVWAAGGDDRRRVVRGGSWYHVAERCRSGHRSWYFSITGVEVLGFRPVLDVEEARPSP